VLEIDFFQEGALTTALIAKRESMINRIHDLPLMLERQFW
jgi:hypothetical protein